MNSETTKTYCTKCPYFTDVIYDGEQWYGAKCKKDGHETMPSMYAIKSLNNNCPLTEDKENKMQILIKISEDTYNSVCNECMLPPDVEDVVQGIKNGKPLPKGHGRLIDADALPLNDIDDANYGSNYIRIAPTVVEADKENQ